MMLADPAKILDKLNFDVMMDIQDTIAQSLDDATPILASRLLTSFDALTTTDVFYLREPGYQDGGSVQTELRLTYGFVTAITAYQVGTMVSDLAGGLAVDGSAAAFLRGEKGVICDYQTRYWNNYVWVTYTSGFPVSPDNPDMYDLTKVPDWLQQAAKMLAQIDLAGMPEVTEAGIKLDAKTLNSQYEALIRAKVRYTPVAIYSMT